MPYRRTRIVVGEIYHIFNRSVASQPIFIRQKDYLRALEVIKYYSYSKTNLRFSHFQRLPLKQKSDFIASLSKNGNVEKRIKILAFCLMPNHIHFLIKEEINHGITTFMRNFQNSYAKYYNIKTKRAGALFQSMFKAVRIETEEQILHVSRYIHLNPYSSYIVKRKEDLNNYQWSSFPEYISKQKPEIVSTDILSEYFPSVEKLISFTLNQADYQRKLENIKHLTFE